MSSTSSPPITQNLPTNNDPKLSEKEYLRLSPEFGHDPRYWQEYHKIVNNHDREMIVTLNSHLDNLLIFAGLFAVVNTAFIVLSLTLLKASASDSTNDLLRLLISQSISNTSLIEATSPPWQLKDVGIRTSYLFSGSLSCSLLAALGALLGKQWMSYYERTGQIGNENKRAITRQRKSDAVNTYHFRSILDALSILIQFSVLLFLIGLIDYIKDLHDGVASLVLGVVVIGSMIYVYTMLAAVWDPQCPFQTPISRMLRSILLHLRASFFLSLKLLQRTLRSVLNFIPTGTHESGDSNMSQDIESGASEKGVGRRIRRMPVVSHLRGVFKRSSHESSTRSDASDVSDSGRYPRAFEPSEEMESYAKSVRWLLETTTRKEALLEAARNIPTLHHVITTRTIFDRPDVPFLGEIPRKVHDILLRLVSGQSVDRFDTSGPGTLDTAIFTATHHKSYILKSPAYLRLVSLFRESLTRLILSRGLRESSDAPIEDAVVYGRALCHALVSSPVAALGFKKLSDELQDLSSTAWISQIDGELRLILMCTTNHPRFWLYLEDMEDSWDAVDASVLPVYIASMTIASLAETASNRDRWLTRLAHRALSVPDSVPTGRVIGLAAVSLSTLAEDGHAHVPALMQGLWDAYSSDSNIIEHIIAALRAYPAGAEVTPAYNRTYAALVTSFRQFVEELQNSRLDDFYHRIQQIQRERLRRVLSRLATEVLGAFEEILSDITTQIGSITPVSEVAQGNTRPLSILPENNHQRTSRGDLDTASLLQYNILLTLKQGVVDRHWGAIDLHPSGRILWEVSTTVEMDSDALGLVLELMKKTSEDRNGYIDLFQKYPSVALIITRALTSTKAGIRDNAINLMRDKARLWFQGSTKDVNQQFSQAEFDKSLAMHVQLGNSMHRRVLSIIRVFETEAMWRTKFLDAFYGVALAVHRAPAFPDSVEITQLALDVWHELTKSGASLEMQPVEVIARYNEWLSEEMLLVVTDHVQQLMENYRRANAWTQIQISNVGISASLQEYIEAIQRSTRLHRTDARRLIIRTFREWKTMVEHP